MLKFILFLKGMEQRKTRAFRKGRNRIKDQPHQKIMEHPNESHERKENANI
jgi:hypothetical protein